MLSRMTSTPASLGLGEDPLVEDLLAVVDRDVGAELAAERRACAAVPAVVNTRAPALVGELDRHRADAAACRRARAGSRRAAAGRRSGRTPSTTRCTSPRAARRRRPARCRAGRASAGRPARRPARRSRRRTSSAHTSSPTFQPATDSPSAAIVPGALQAEVRRGARRRRVVALPLHAVGAVHRRRRDLDQHLARRRAPGRARCRPAAPRVRPARSRPRHASRPYRPSAAAREIVARMQRITVGVGPITEAELVAVARHGAGVELSADALAAIAASRGDRRGPRRRRRAALRHLDRLRRAGHQAHPARAARRCCSAR